MTKDIIQKLMMPHTHRMCSMIDKAGDYLELTTGAASVVTTLNGDIA
jgi:hypothetical protein